MGLKKMTFQQKSNLWVDSIEKQLTHFRGSYHNISALWNFQNIINEKYTVGDIPSNDFDICVKDFYGYPEDVNDIEYRLAKILYLQSILLDYEKIGPDPLNINGKKIEILIKNTTKRIIEYFPEYDISPRRDKEFVTFEPKEVKVVTDNLSDISIEIADPIKDILQPFKTENEIIGCISKIYKEFENVKKEDLINLNKVDKSIYYNAWVLAKQVVNNVDGAKGHKGKSELSIKDIAHNFALNASLVQKLIHLNESKNR